MADWFPLGDAQLLVVSDGVLRLDAGAIFGLTPRVMWEPFAGALDEEHRLGMGLNCLLVRSQGKLILVETGVGSKATRLPGAAGVGEAGSLLANLARHGVRPEDVDIVINTHLHFDHCGGNTTYRDESSLWPFRAPAISCRRVSGRRPTTPTSAPAPPTLPRIWSLWPIAASWSWCRARRR